MVMIHRLLFPTVLLVTGLFMAGGCGRQAPQNQSMLSSTVHRAAGIQWSVPAGWSVQPERPMRVATYQVPAPTEGLEAGECAVFYFGSDQGGNVEMNIQRWAGQFESTPTPEQSTREVNGIQVTEVKIAGTYLAPAGPMMASQGRKENFRLLGAIVEAPQGSVFFKLTGPASVVENSAASMDALISSLQNQE